MKFGKLTLSGYAALSSVLLAVGLLVVGGRAYSAWAAIFLILSLMFLARVKRNYERDREQDRSAPSENTDADMKRTVREQELEASKTRWGGWR